MKNGIGRGDKHDNTRQRIDRKDNDQDAEGNQSGNHKLGQILAVIGVQRLDALDRGRSQLAGALSPCVSWPQI